LLIKHENLRRNSACKKVFPAPFIYQARRHIELQLLLGDVLVPNHYQIPWFETLIMGLAMGDT